MSHRTFLAALLLLPLAPARGSDDPAPSDPLFLVEPAEGEPFEARLRSIAADGSLQFLPASGDQRDIAPAGLFKLGRLNTPPVASHQNEGLLLLAGNDRLSCSLSHFDDEFAHVASKSLGVLRISLEYVVGFASGTGRDRMALDDHVRALLSTERESDLTWLKNGDRLTGSIAALTEDTLVVVQEQGRTTLDRGQIQAIALDPALLLPPPPMGAALELYLSDSSRITGVPTALEGGKLSLTTAFGAVVQVPIEQVVLAYVVGGPSTFLADIEPAGSEYVEYIGPVLPFRTDRSVLGGPLRVGGVSHERGIGTQSRTLLAYRLDGTATRFRARVALDDTAGPWASVVFKILLDGQSAYESPLLKSGEQPVSIDLPLGQARLLILSTDFGSNGNVQDYADWIEARLVK